MLWQGWRTEKVGGGPRKGLKRKKKSNQNSPTMRDLCEDTAGDSPSDLSVCAPELVEAADLSSHPT